MGHTKGWVSEIRLGASGQTEVAVECPPIAIPHPGQYLMALDEENTGAVLATPLFAIREFRHGFWASPLHLVNWDPGTALDLVGPLGHGFTLPANIRRLGVVAMGETVSRLLPLIDQAAQATGGMTLFTDLGLPSLPAALEIYPLSSLPEALDWPDYLVLDLPLCKLETLRSVLGLEGGAILPCPAQVLLTTSMPCAGLGQCGVCAVRGRRGWKLACDDGPVFDLQSLSW